MSAACGQDGTPEASGAPATVSPEGDRPVAVWRLEGGFLQPGLLAIRPPRVVVYGEGQAIVDAARTLRLSQAELSDLVSALARDLSGQPATATPRPGTPVVMDAPTTVLGVRAAGGEMREVRIPALDESGDGYAGPLLNARARLDRLAQRAATEGQDYSSERVRLVAEETQGGKARAWPEGVPEPPGTGAPVHTRDLSGNAASAAARLIPYDAGQQGDWPVYRAPSGVSLAVSWRYLLPDE
ncbi:hypothetical protein [Nonomuraea basaltis]|uniref:hypothetical protein n=1 Tax=Nonomuraea basaltis TaxID=2495887 RepID=UPI00110C45DA|nr:hypothetical protein [Nonomuraea basaltis]TMR95755.1 hypothetical protein EJK15_26860 [Nonomuraea basaltis]